jgi:hypothetical protein
MDTLQHMLHGYIMADAVGASIETSTISAYIGGYADFVGQVGKLDGTGYLVYNNAHKFHWTNFILPQHGLHTFIDLFTHNEGSRWWKWKERMYIEIIGWLFILIYFYWRYNARF